jgi:REP element-mobilizing transposase RayT
MVRPKQLSFPCRGRGGFRPGAGRKRGPRVSHHGRKSIAKPLPLHVVWRTQEDVPSLRGKKLFRQVRESFHRCHEKEGYRLTHFSVISNHMHALVEADSAQALSRGMQGLGVSMAKRINMNSDRHGPVFEDRYFARQLHTPREVANALDYVIRNQERHQLGRVPQEAPPARPDPFCSAAFPLGTGPPLVAVARTWLLTTGWRRALAA